MNITSAQELIRWDEMVSIFHLNARKPPVLILISFIVVGLRASTKKIIKQRSETG